MSFYSRMISAWPYHCVDCSADQQSCGKDRENFMCCSFNIIYLFLKYVKIINRPESENYTFVTEKNDGLRIILCGPRHRK